MGVQNPYTAEVRFLNKKLSSSNIDWEPRQAISQLLSPMLSTDEARKIHDELKSALAPKAKDLLDKMVFLVPVKQMTRVVISVSPLREIFAGEIDGGAGGGGGSGYTPFRTSLTGSRR